MKFDVVVVGAGFAGSVIAERMASEYGKTVLVVEVRDHIGGNAYDDYDEHGILVHRYGPHIFHTNSVDVYRYLSQFTDWIPYQHKVLSYVDGRLVPFPINADTINELYGTDMDSSAMERFFAQQRVNIARIENSEHVIVSQVGIELYKKFFKGYTTKQWGIGPDQLDPSVCGRIPIRTNRDPRYFTDRFQAMPKRGYTAMFRNMLHHPCIHVLLKTDFSELRHAVEYEHLYYTGPIDGYFSEKHGALPYRSLEFQFDYYETPLLQPVATINYPNDHEYTRVTEMKHITSQQHSGTTLVTEYPRSDGDPYYPVPTNDSQRIYSLYKAEADSLRQVTFAGRLGTYKYYNMDQVVAQALTLSRSREKMPVSGDLLGRVTRRA